MLQIDNYDDVVGKLSCFKTLIKYDNTLQEVFLHNKSAYVLGDRMNGRIEFLERRFESIVKIPFGEDFKSSDDVESNELSDKIAIVNEQCRTYCDTLFYINKYELLEFMHSNYNSAAKLNKISLTIEVDDGIVFKFNPKKKSISVFPCEYRIDTIAQMNPNFRIAFGQLTISALLLYEVLSNDLLSKNVRIEINTRKKILRASCIIENMNSRFIISEDE